jgi:aminopeptidase 2
LGTFNKHDDLDEQRFKALMFGNSGGDEIVVKAAMEMFKRFVRGDGGPINANIRAEVFEIVLKRGGKKEVSTFLNNSAPYLRIG